MASTIAFGFTLQDCVDRYLRSLKVPTKLLAIRPTGRGNPGNFAALSPAITLSILSTFEGFAEDFTATALYVSGEGLPQIARKVGAWNNPTVRDFQNRLKADFPLISKELGKAIELKIYRPANSATSGWWNWETIGWERLLDDADSWMQVRHSLTHGLATGWGSERWPGPLRSTSSASTVLRSRGRGLHSLVLHGALNCARIYSRGAQHVADLVAHDLHQSLDWTGLPDFTLPGT